MLFLDPWVATKVSFLGQSINSRSTKRSGKALANRCFLSGKQEETVDHLLIHCSKARILRDLLLAIVGVS